MAIASVRTDFPNNSHYSQIVIAARQQVMLTYYALSLRTTYERTLSRKNLHLDAQPYSEHHANHDGVDTCGQGGSRYFHRKQGIQWPLAAAEIIRSRRDSYAACTNDNSNRLRGVCFDRSCMCNKLAEYKGIVDICLSHILD